MARSLFGQAEIAVASGAPSTAIPLLERMTAIDEAIGYRRGVVGAEVMSAVVSVLTGDPEGAVDRLEDARQFLSDLARMSASPFPAGTAHVGSPVSTEGT